MIPNRPPWRLPASNPRVSDMRSTRKNQVLRQRIAGSTEPGRLGPLDGPELFTKADSRCAYESCITPSISHRLSDGGPGFRSAAGARTPTAATRALTGRAFRSPAPAAEHDDRDRGRHHSHRSRHQEGGLHAVVGTLRRERRLTLLAVGGWAAGWRLARQTEDCQRGRVLLLDASGTHGRVGDSKAAPHAHTAGIRGGDRNRTGVRGFAGRCLTTRPPRRRKTRREPGERPVYPAPFEASGAPSPGLHFRRGAIHDLPRVRLERVAPDQAGARSLQRDRRDRVRRLPLGVGSQSRTPARRSRQELHPPAAGERREERRRAGRNAGRNPLIPQLG